MARVRVRYYVVKNGCGYWQPTRRMRQQGFYSIRCGEDGPSAWATATEWNRRWDAHRKGLPADLTLPQFPIDSLGEAFIRYQATTEWSRKAPRTREEWLRVWERIGPVFGDQNPSVIKFDHLSKFRDAMEKRVSLGEAHRCIKIWRALWKVAAAMGYCNREADPSLAVRNSAPKGRSAYWHEGEVVRIYKTAWRLGYHGLAAIIAVAWSTQMSPGDVRTLRAGQMARSDEGLFFTDRKKTGKPVGGLLTPRTAKALAAYVAHLDPNMAPDAPLFRNRSGVPYSSDTMGDDFRDVRAALFGVGDKRTLADFRRSGAIEAIAGKANPAQLAHAMGNTLSASNFLFETYAPVNLSSLSAIVEARRKGREILRKK